MIKLEAKLWKLIASSFSAQLAIPQLQMKPMFYIYLDFEDKNQESITDDIE